MVEYINKDQDGLIKKEMTSLTGSKLVFERFSKESYFLGSNSKFKEEQESLSIISSEFNNLIKLIHNNMDFFNSFFKKIIINELKNINYLSNNLIEEIKKNNPTSALSLAISQSPNEEFLIEIRESLSALIYGISELISKIKSSLQFYQLFDSYKQDFLTKTKVDLENLSKEFNTKNIDNLNNLKKNLNIYHNSLDEVDKQIKTNADSTKSNFNEILKLNTDIQDIKKNISHVLENAEQRAIDTFDTIYDDFLGDINKKEKNLDDEIANIDKAIEGYKELISDKATEKMTSVYLSKADSERFIYYLFTILSLAIIGCAIGYSIWSLIDFVHDSHQIQSQLSNQLKNSATLSTSVYTSENLQYLGLRLIFSLIIFSTVIYTTRIASRAYLHWKKYEAMFLKLSALKPFIIEMSKEKKIEIHEKLVDVYFGKDNGDHSLNEKIKDLPKNISDLLGKVVDNASSFSESVTGKKDGQKLSNEAEDK